MPRPPATVPAILATAVACVAALAGCTGSGTTSKSGSPTAPTTTSTDRSAGSSDASSSSSRPGSGKSGKSTAKPIDRQTIQGSHLTYKIEIWARDTQRSCADHAIGSKLVALLRGKQCTLTRLAGTTSANGKAIGVSRETLTFGGPSAAGSRAATQVAILLTGSPTEGLVDLLRDGKKLPSGPAEIPNAAPRNAVNDASSVTAVRTWYLSGSTAANDPRLSEAVEDLSVA